MKTRTSMVQHRTMLESEYVNLLRQHEKCRIYCHNLLTYPGTLSELLPWFGSVLSSVCCKPDSKGFAVMMTLEWLEPGMGSKAGNGTERPRVSLAILTVSNIRFCWALSKKKCSLLPLLTTGVL